MHAYPKKILTLQEQVQSIIDAGVQVADGEALKTALTTIGYYRLRGYMFPYYDNAGKKYREHTSFERILMQYHFDQELSLLLTDMLTQIEVALRARVVDALLLSKDALVYLDATYFDNKTDYWKNIASISMEVSRSSDVFIEHNLRRHEGQVPIWAVVEVMSFGTLSKLIKSLGHSSKSGVPIYQTLAGYYSYPSEKNGHRLTPKPDMLASWIHMAVIFRNICAHNARIYNRSLTVKPQIVRVDMRAQQPKFTGLYEGILAMKYLRPTDEAWRHFAVQLIALLKKYEAFIELERLNFPKDWQAHILL